MLVTFLAKKYVFHTPRLVQKHQCDQLCTAITCTEFTASKTYIRPTCALKNLSDTYNLTQPDARLLKSYTTVNKTDVFIHTAQSAHSNGDTKWMTW